MVMGSMRTMKCLRGVTAKGGYSSLPALRLDARVGDAVCPAGSIGATAGQYLQAITLLCRKLRSLSFSSADPNIRFSSRDSAANNRALPLIGSAIPFDDEYIARIRIM